MSIRSYPLLTGAVTIFALGTLIYVLRGPDEVSGMTAVRNEKKTMVTVPLDSGMEAVVTLDHVTCEMTGYVLDRFTGRFFVQYRYNVARHFDVRRDRPPQFLVGAGRADFRQFSGNERLADGVIYVSDAASGQVVAFGIPWNTQLRANSAAPQRRLFLPLDAARTRFINPDQFDP